MLQLLNDPTYEVLKKDPTSIITKKTNEIINRLHKLKLIDKKTATTLEAKNSLRPCIYGQPKAHKPDLPLRPVVPNITAPTYKLAKFACKILQSSFNSEFNIKDSFQLVKVLQQIKLPPEYTLVSFDVVSLFTNTPKRLIIHDIIMNWDTIGKATNINLDIFIEIIELCLESCYFSFGQKFYRQKEGTAMGSPTSPILCDLVMEGLLKNCTKKLNFSIPLLVKYVDDLLLALPKDNLDHVLETFNSYHPKLQFTMETTKNNGIAFLDTFITINEDRTLNTEWYSKDISSGRLLNYCSLHPTSVKLNVARNFIKRVIKFDSQNQQSKQHTTIHKILRKNNYPKQLINRLINSEQQMHQHEQPSPTEKTISKQPSTTAPPTQQQAPTSPAQHLQQNKTEQPSAAVSPTQQQAPISPTNQSSPTKTTISKQPSAAAPPTQQAPTSPTQHLQQIITEQPSAAVPSTSQKTPTSPAHRLQHNPTNDDHHQTAEENPPTNDLQSTSPTAESNEHNTSQQIRYFPLTFIPNLSNQIAKLLKIDYGDIRIANNIPKPLGMLFPRAKDAISSAEIPNIVYSIPCQNCPKQYIGMSRNNLKTRLVGHKSNITKYEQLTSRGFTQTDPEMVSIRENCTALLAHIIDKTHMMDLERANVIDKTRRLSSLPILEMCHIYTTKNTLNFRTDVNNLSSTYANILQCTTNTRKTRHNVSVTTRTNHKHNTNTENLNLHQ